MGTAVLLVRVTAAPEVTVTDTNRPTLPAWALSPAVVPKIPTALLGTISPVTAREPPTEALFVTASAVPAPEQRSQSRIALQLGALWRSQGLSCPTAPWESLAPRRATTPRPAALGGSYPSRSPRAQR